MKRQPTPEQKAKAEERRAHLRELWQKIGEMSAEERAALAERMILVTTCEGHTLSPNNSIFLSYQAESITVVGGFQQWKKANRQVKKGERSLGIWIPARKEEQDPKPKDPTQPEKGQFFIFGSVFDISQTEPIQEKESNQ